MSGKQRIDEQRAFVLHLYPYSETSLIVDVFSRDYGRLALLARGARRPRSALRGLLMAFQPLELGWFGAGEVKTLAKAEWIGGMPLLSGRCLLLGYYLNELLVRMLPREDPHGALFDAYSAALHALAHGGEDAPELRRFEKTLLKDVARVELTGDYPGWAPNPASKLLALAQAVYGREFGGTAAVKVIHAGLECGIIGARHPGLDILSFGPDIRGAHAPGERVRVESVAQAWRLLTALLAAVPPEVDWNREA